MSYDLLVSVSEDVINYIAEAVIFDANSKRIYLKNKDGSPNKKSCLYALGLDTRFISSGDVILSEEKEVKHRIPSLLVRHPEVTYILEYVKLYAGKRRAVYDPPESLYPWLRNISFDGNIIHLVVENRETYNINEIGNDY